MSTKKFVAKDMRQALQQVRDELGADAVILSNRKVAEGIEIVAAADYDAFVEQHNEKERRSNHIPDFMADGAKSPAQGDPARVLEEGLLPSEQDKAKLLEALQRRDLANQKFTEAFEQRMQAQSDQPVQPVMDDEPQVHISQAAKRQFSEPTPPSQTQVEYRPAAEAQAPVHKPQQQPNPMDSMEPIPQQMPQQPQPAMQAPPVSPELKAMMGEINQLRQMMNVQMANVAWGNFSHRHPLEAAVFKKLARLGLSSELCRKLVRNLAPDTDMKTAWKQCLLELSDDLPLMQDDITQHGGVFAFVGPAGVGKTTTISKIATRFVLENGAENLALITTDSYRIAGHEQLATLGRILKVPVRVVTEQQSLDQILRSLSRKKLILIDTAGLSHKDQVHSEQMQMLNSMGQDIQRWLVLSSTSQRRILDKAVNEYKHLNLDGCILTKLDESASLGEALSVAIEAQLAIAYITDGQNIPDDIAHPHATRLINHAIALAKGYSMDDEQVADFYSNALTDEEPDVAYG